MRHKAFAGVLIVGLTLSLIANLTLAQESAPQASLGTAFTHEGRPIDAGAPANGSSESLAKVTPTDAYKAYLPLVLSPPADIAPPRLIAPRNGTQLNTISPSFTINNSRIGQPARAELQVSCGEPPYFTAFSFHVFFRRFSGSRTAEMDRNLWEGTKCFWRARSSYDGINWGPWSEAWSFTTPTGGTLPGSPYLISPTEGSTVTSLKPTLTWSAVSGATLYQLTIIHGPTQERFYGLTTTTEVTAPLLYPDSDYYWYVTARNDYGWGYYSGSRLFYTPPVQVGNSTVGVDAGSEEDQEVTWSTR
jgi:hypothetical protein